MNEMQEGGRAEDYVEKVFDLVGLKKRENNFSPKMRKLLQKIGDIPIISMTVGRYPIQSFVRKALNMLSFGKLENILKQLNYDQLFHLFLKIKLSNGDEYTLDKQEVIKLEPYKQKPNTETMNVDMSSLTDVLTINSLLETALKYMGPQPFFSYSGRVYNCQHYIMNILESLKLLTPELKTFIKQDTNQLFEKLPAYVQFISNVSTDLGARANRFLEGEGVKFKDINHFKNAILDDLKNPEKIKSNSSLTARQKLMLLQELDEQ